MPEIINLCLEDSPLPSRTSHPSPKPPRANLPAKVLILSDDADSGGLEVDLPNPKRRRLTPSSVPEEIQQWSGEVREDTAGSQRKARSRGAGGQNTTTTITLGREGTDSGSNQLDDSIVFTSSPQWASVPARKSRLYHKFSSDDDLEDIDILVRHGPGLVHPESKSNQNSLLLSNKTASILAELKQKSKFEGKNKNENVQEMADFGRSGLDHHEDDSLSDTSNGQPRKRSTGSRQSKAERKAAKALKQVEKDKIKAAKAEEKAAKARQKRLEADIAEVNKRKVNKKDSTPEMIVDLPQSMEGTTLGSQTCQFLGNVGVQVTNSNSSSQDSIIKWRRKVVSVFNEEYGYREPVAETIQDEQHILLVLSAKDFVSLAATESSAVQTLDSYFQKFKTRYSKSTPLIVIEGLQVWKNKNKTMENRAFRSGVLQQLPDQVSNILSSQSAARKNTKATKSHTHVPDEMIEDALLRLQIVHSLLVHHTSNTLETAEWITNFTQHISTVPYKLELQRLDTAFCMETGQVTVGKDKTDTYIKMLQEIVRITPPVAIGIQRKYGTVRQLVRALMEQGPLALENVEKTAHGSSGVTGGRIGPALSKRVWKIFTGLDPNSNDGIV